MSFANTRQNQKRPRVLPKAATFAKAYRDLKPKDLVLHIEPDNPNCVSFSVHDDGSLSVGDWTFTPRDALRIAAWISENFR